MFEWDCHLLACTLKAFGDMGPNARTRLILDPDCDLFGHVDSVPPDAPIRDIVDRCRVWESHAYTDARKMPEKARVVCVVSELTFVPTEQVIAAVTSPSVRLADLESMLKRLLLDIPAQAPPPLSAPTDLEQDDMIRLLPVVPAQAPPPHSAPTDIEAMLKRLLPGTPTRAQQPRPVTARRDWSSVLCFSCGEYGHRVGWVNVHG